MKKKKVTLSKNGVRLGRKVGSKDKVPHAKSTDGMMKGQIFLDPDVLENPFIKAMKENLEQGAGQPRAFKTPKLMLETMELYVNWVRKHPIKKEEPVNGVMQMVQLRRPLTLGGYCLYCGVSEAYLRVFKSTTVKDEPGFITVIKTIEQYINDDLFEGAAVGQFNANLISKKLGLSENINMNHGIQADQVASLFPFKRPDDNEPKQLE